MQGSPRPAAATCHRCHAIQSAMSALPARLYALSGVPVSSEEELVLGCKHFSSFLAHVILPRLIRFRDAPTYLGMDKDRFNLEVRPYIVEVPIGKQGVAFDRLDLDAWADQYKAREGRPGAKDRLQWDGSNQQVQRDPNRASRGSSSVLCGARSYVMHHGAVTPPFFHRHNGRIRSESHCRFSPTTSCA